MTKTSYYRGMFRDLLSRLFNGGSSPQPLVLPDVEVAIAALLVCVARADGHYKSLEQQRIDRMLSRYRGLTKEEAAERRLAAEMIESEAPDTVRFTRLIKDHIALEYRAAVIGLMWETAYADEERAPDEEAVVRLIAGLLGVPDRDSALMRQKVLQDMGLARD